MGQREFLPEYRAAEGAGGERNEIDTRLNGSVYSSPPTPLRMQTVAFVRGGGGVIVFSFPELPTNNSRKWTSRGLVKWNNTTEGKKGELSFGMRPKEHRNCTSWSGTRPNCFLFSFFLSPLLISAPRLLSEKIFLSFWSLVFIVLLLLLFSCAPNRFTTPRVPHCLRVTLSVKSTTAKLFAPNPETLPNRTTNEAKRNHTPHRKQQGVCSLVRCRRGKKINK